MADRHVKLTSMILRRALPALAVCLTAALSGCSPSRGSVRTNADAVTTSPALVAIGSLGDSPEAVAVRTQLVQEVTRRQILALTDDPQLATMCLRGEAGLWRDARNARDLRAFGRLALAPCSGGAAIWQHEYREGALSAGARSRIPDELVLRVALQFADRLEVSFKQSR